MIDVQLARDLVGCCVTVKLIGDEDPYARFVQDEFLNKTYVGELKQVQPMLRATRLPMAGSDGKMQSVLEHLLHVQESSDQTYVLRTWLIERLEAASF